MEYKECKKCGQVKPIDEFGKDKYSSDGFTCYCKECRNLQSKKYYSKHKDEIKLQKKEYREKNPDKIINTRRKYKYRNKVYYKRYYERHREQILGRKKRQSKSDSYRYKRRKRQNNKYYTDIRFKLDKCISSVMYTSLKRNKNGHHWEDLVGYTLDDLMTHLESLFQPGMSWDNYGDWHIDHIIPRSYFNFTSYDDPEFIQCWSLDNLQPLWAEENLKKSNKLMG